LRPRRSAFHPRARRPPRTSRKALTWGCVFILACTGDLRFAGDGDGGLPGIGGDANDASEGDDATVSGGSKDASGSDGRTDAGVPLCRTDTDCQLPGLHCDTASGTCVECVSDAHCSGDAGWPRCDSEIHRCVVCRGSADCPPAMTCEPVTRSCLFACTDAGVCPGGRQCDSARSICVECTSKAQCPVPGRGACETATGLCTECASNADCSSPRPYCDRTRGTCAQCLSQRDCSSGSVCDFGTNSCITVR